jgi:DNA-binding NtrC family response regulator
MVTGYGSIESAIDAMKRGAADYVLKPIDNDTLLAIVRRNLEVVRLRKDNSFLKKELLHTVYSHEIITQDPVFLGIVARLDSVKNSIAPILLIGESGTGKEVLARYLHFTSNRSDGPFVGINCAALSEELLLSELFGHERGAFTGAVERKLGKFEQADKGTLFLDEIGDMSPGIQAKLLRALEENSFERVGGTRRITVDIRVVAATNQDLMELIQLKKFRKDLYYRIAAVEIRLPPLRERRCDISGLAGYFVQRYACRYNKKIERISPDVLERWQAYDWPGNIRELQNVVHQAVLMCKAEEIGFDALEPGTIRTRTAKEDGFSPERYATLKELSAAAAAHYERLKIQEVLDASGGNKSKSARTLDITRKTLAKKMDEYGIAARPL